MNLLIVDDNVTVREMMKSLFSDLAEQVYESANGEEAINSYASHHQDWVLMDIEMPICDGLAATRRIKDRSPDARIIIVTSHNSKVLRQAALDAGAYAYVLKDDLIDLHRILSGAGNSGSGSGEGRSSSFFRNQLNFFMQFLSFEIGMMDSSTTVRGFQSRLILKMA